MIRPKRKKLQPRANKIFLGLIKKYKIYDFGVRPTQHPRFPQSITFLFFKTHHLLLTNIFYIFSLAQA